MIDNFGLKLDFDLLDRKTIANLNFGNQANHDILDEIDYPG